MLAGVLIAVLVSLGWISAQVAVSRRRPSSSRLRQMFSGFLVSLPLVALALAVLHGTMPKLWTLLAGAEHLLAVGLHAYVAHLLIFFFYVECFYHIERSVTLRLLIEILHRQGRLATAAEIAEGYKVDDMIEERLSLLTANHYLSHEGDRFRLLPKGRRFASGVQLFCWIFQSKTQDERL